MKSLSEKVYVHPPEADRVSYFPNSHSLFNRGVMGWGHFVFYLTHSWGWPVTKSCPMKCTGSHLGFWEIHWKLACPFCPLACPSFLWKGRCDPEGGLLLLQLQGIGSQVRQTKFKGRRAVIYPPWAPMWQNIFPIYWRRCWFSFLIMCSWTES